ncbi:hypothetical protein QJQ45_007341 [Haematococcus lacustris]|nr:hypothetical protein QJQ45_007341 [Haematococcus lacustris]
MAKKKRKGSDKKQKVSRSAQGKQAEERLVRPAWSQERGQPVWGPVWCPIVAPRRPPQAPRSSQAATQPAASEPGPSTPPPAKRSKRTKAEPAAEPTKGKGKAKGKAAKAKPAPQPGRWLDRDCNAALNMQRIGESRWRPLELCYWPDQGALPAKGKEYPGLGYKRLRDMPPKAQDQQQQPAVAKKCKLAHLIDHLSQEHWDAFLADAVHPRVEAISERAVLASLLLGLLVRGLFTIHVADPLGLHDQPVYTDIPVSQVAIPDLSCWNLLLQLCRGLPGNGANTLPK